jgi:transposase-like protein
MEKIGRQRRSESGWRELVGRQAQSGLTVPQFCQQEGISSASLYGWRTRLRRGAKSEATRNGKPGKKDLPSNSATGFVDLGSVGSSSSRFEVRLDLGQGVLLHLVRG